MAKSLIYSSELFPNNDPITPSCRYNSNFLSVQEANDWLHVLQEQVKWSQHQIRMFGKWIPEPRKIAYFGTHPYTYSGKTLEAIPFPDFIMPLKSLIEIYTNRSFNAVLLNLYRNENDSMGWHADDEKSLGDAPFIASLSLGSRRLFKFRYKQNHQIQYHCILEHGSLLCMYDQCQTLWQHALPKTKKSEIRINATFRTIYG